MSSITLQLREVHAHTDGNIGLTGEGSWTPYDGAPEGFKEALNQKITNHFWTREIGMETIEMWRWHMRRRMNEIMPFYNKLYKSELIKFDPLSTVNISNVSKAKQKQVGTNKENTNSESTNESANRAVVSDFPQQLLAENGDYATNASDSTGKTGSVAKAEGDSESTSDSEDEATSTSTGYSGPASALLNAYRQTLLNVDMMVIDDLNELFMFVYSNGDSYTSRY